MGKIQKTLLVLLILWTFLVCLFFLNMGFVNIFKRHLEGDSGNETYGGIRSVPDSAYLWIARLRMEKISPFVSEDETVLEYGVEFGWNIALLKCKKRIGFDRSTSFADIVRKYEIKFIHDLAAVPDGSVDVVVCHHVLEHAEVPINVLKETGRLLRPRGKLLVFVPYETGERTKRYDPKDPYHRLFSWNVQSLGNLVETNGFKVIRGKIGRFGYDRFSAVWADRYHLGEFGFRVLRRAIHFVKPAFEVEIVAERK